MKKFFIKLKREVDIFEKTIRPLNKSNKSILCKGLNYEETKNINIEDAILFMERDIHLAIKEGELPGLKTRIEPLLKNNQVCLLVHVFDVQTDGFYNQETKSLSVSKGVSIFCDVGTFREKLSSYIKKKINQILWSHNYMKMFSNDPDRFRFQCKIQVSLENLKETNISPEEADKLFDPYFKRVARENKKMTEDDFREHFKGPSSGEFLGIHHYFDEVDVG